MVDPIYQSTTKKVFNKINSYKAIYKIIAKLNPVFTPNLNEAKILLNINNNLKKFEKAWWIASFSLFFTQLFDLQYYDLRISLIFWIFISGLICKIQEINKEELN